MTDDKRDPAFVPPLEWMTPAEQIRRQTGPGTEGLPGFVVIEPTIPRPYYQDELGNWRQVDDDDEGRETT
jgi:hypothetical protein